MAKQKTSKDVISSQLSFFLNGEKVEIDNPDPSTLLVDYLRSTQVGLTGTKHACGQGGCGSCTVTLSYFDNATNKVCNISANSCLRPIVALDGMEVTTVEGLGSVDTEVSPVQYKIAKDNGSQCGYCTPGFVMNMHSLLIAKEGKPLTQKEIEEWFDGNICRCTGYRPILYAMKSFASDWSAKDEKGTPECFVDPSERVLHYKKEKGTDPAHLIKKPRELYFEGRDKKWFRPLTIVALERLMAKHKVGNELKLVFGNTSRGIPATQPISPKVYIDISQIKELRTLKADKTQLHVGASNTYNEFREFLEALIAKANDTQKEALEALHYMTQHTAGNIVRNAASLAGNTMLVARNAKQHQQGTPFPSDLFTALCTLDAKVIVRVKGKDVTLPILKFAHKYGDDKAFADAAVLVRYIIPLTAKNEYMTCYKVAIREINSHSLANTGIYVQLDKGKKVVNTRFVVGGIDTIAFHAEKTEKYLIGKVWDHTTLKGALEVLHKELNAVIKGLPKWFTSKPSEGISNDYRRALVEGYFYKFFLEIGLKLDPKTIPAADKSGIGLIKRGVSKGTQHYEKYIAEYPVNVPYIKLSAFEQATGEAIYTHDIPVPVRGLFGSFVTSKRALAKFSYQWPSGKGRVKATDIAGLITHLKNTFPSFVDYITYLDIPKGGANGTASTYAPDPIFCVKDVTTYGQSLGLVLAKTENDANDIAEFITNECVAYIEKTPVLTIEEALKKGDIFPNYDSDDNHQIVAPNSDIKWALKTTPAELNSGYQYAKKTINGQVCEVIAGTQFTSAQIHFYMESQSVMAYPGEQREMDIHSSTQSPNSVQGDIAKTLNIQANNVTVYVKRLGGGYGGKTTRTSFVASPAAIAARKHNEPVRIAMPRDVDTAMIGKRHPFLGEWNIAVVSEGKDRGKILGTYTRFYSDGGNTQDCSFDVMDCCILGSDNSYHVPNFFAKGDVVKTNLASNNAMRSYGGVQGGIIMEEAIEAAAHRLGMRPEEIREKSLYRENDKTPYGQVLDYCLARPVWDRIKRTSDFDRRVKAVEEFNKNNRWKKRGISMIPLKYGLGYNLGFLMQGMAQLDIFTADCTVLIQHGGVEMGQGIMTKIAQIAAETLNVPLDLIHMTGMDTAVTPNAIGTGATSGTDLNGGAVQAACEGQKQKLMNMCESFKAQNGEKWCKDQGIDYWNYKEGWRKKVTTGKVTQPIWNNIISLAFQNAIDLSTQAIYNTPGLDLSKDQQFYGFTYSAACTEVEIDVLTGVTNVMRSDLLYDIGKSINPAIDIGQIEGAFVMGLGYMTSEYWVSEPKGTPNPAGTLNTINTWTYKPPATISIPEDFRVDLFPRDTAAGIPTNPNLLMSSKGVGEPPLVLANTVFFAIKHAILAARKDRGHDGWFKLDNPATVERIREACLVGVEDLKY
jgi:xanthine dehydrogenase/oxidase